MTEEIKEETSLPPAEILLQATGSSAGSLLTAPDVVTPSGDSAPLLSFLSNIGKQLSSSIVEISKPILSKENQNNSANNSNNNSTTTSPASSRNHDNTNNTANNTPANHDNTHNDDDTAINSKDDSNGNDDIRRSKSFEDFCHVNHINNHNNNTNNHNNPNMTRRKSTGNNYLGPKNNNNNNAESNTNNTVNNKLKPFFMSLLSRLPVNTEKKEVDNVVTASMSSSSASSTSSSGSATGAAIWEDPDLSSRLQLQLRNQIELMCYEKWNFLETPPTDPNFPPFVFLFEEFLPAAVSALSHIPHLDKLRFALVPTLISEEKFWYNFFARVHALKYTLLSLQSSPPPTSTSTSAATQPLPAYAPRTPLPDTEYVKPTNATLRAPIPGTPKRKSVEFAQPASSPVFSHYPTFEKITTPPSSESSLASPSVSKTSATNQTSRTAELDDFEEALKAELGDDGLRLSSGDVNNASDSIVIDEAAFEALEKEFEDFK